MLSSRDIKTIRATQVQSLPDTCYIQALTTSTNTYGEVTESWADSGSPIACGLEMQSGSEVRKPDKVVVNYDAILRVAITSLPLEAQRIRVTKRHNETITAVIFNIASPIQRGASGNRILLNKVSV